MSYFKNIFISIDQLGNAIAGGNPDCTISGRVGYYSEHASILVKWYWVMLKYIVNFTFFPLDGPDHCHYAYHNDESEKYIAPKGLIVFTLSLITIGACLVLVPINYLLWLFRIIEPKRTEKYKLD